MEKYSNNSTCFIVRWLITIPHLHERLARSLYKLINLLQGGKE